MAGPRARAGQLIGQAAPLDLRLGPKDGSMQYEVHKSVRVKSSEYMRSRGLTYS
jgi:hypothetical protein